MNKYEGMIETVRRKGHRPGMLAEIRIENGYAAVLSAGSNAIDGGANIGRHTMRMSQCVGGSGTVFSCEPVPEVMVKLQKNLHEMNAVNVCCFCFALSDKIEVVDFTVCKNAIPYSSLRPRKDWPAHIDAEIEVRKVFACPLDVAIPRHMKIHFIKLDLEGGEFPAMRGARRLIERDRPLIVFENGRQKPAEIFGYTAHEFFGFFDDLNYDLSTIDGRPFERKDWLARMSVFYFWASPRECTPNYREQFPDWTEKAFQAICSAPSPADKKEFRIGSKRLFKLFAPRLRRLTDKNFSNAR